MKDFEPITILLVDDDQLVLNDLLGLIDWESEGYEIIVTAFNGKQALELFKMFQPNIVLTDIIMPIMNGIDLIKEIKKQHDKTEFLVLSSYDEFSYAKSAMTLGVSDYVLKMELTPEYLLEKLNDLSSKIRNNQKSFLYHQRLILQEYMLHHDVESSIFDKISNKKFDFYAIGLDSGYRREVFCQHTLKPFSTHALSMMKETFHLSDDDLIFTYEHYIIIGYLSKLVSSRSKYNRRDIVELLSSLPFTTKLFYLDQPCTIKSFRTLFEKKLNICNYQLLFSSMTQFSLEKTGDSDNHKTYASISPSVLLSQLFSDHSTEQDILEYMKTVHCNMQTSAAVALYRYACRITNQNPDVSDCFSDFDSFSEFIIDCYHEYMAQKESEKSYSLHVARAVSYIESNYSNSNLSNEVIADNLGISCGRLSVLFKKETEKTLGEYITDYRIQKATELLLNSNKKIYEIAAMVGYNSSQYFSQIFLHKTGKKPLDFRQASITTIKIGE